MKITVIGTGYVGLVTGVSLSEIGHEVTCIDIDTSKIKQLNQSKSPIYEPGIEELIQKNLANGNLKFHTDIAVAMKESALIYLAVGTPQRENGEANLDYIEAAAKDIAQAMHQDTIVVVKSTVPIGTNQKLQRFIQAQTSHKVSIVSNPEFLREGSALVDVFHGDRIVIGAQDEEAMGILEEVNEPFQIPIVTMTLESAEMVKYASNAFLATKISFINEIANICERTGSDIREVSYGMGLDRRIGKQFLQAGIGYGGSCFPKDTMALNQIAKNVGYDFSLLQSVIDVNTRQRLKLVDILKAHYSDLQGKKVGLLGVAFKPETDDIREAAAEFIIEELLRCGAEISIYDPIASENMAEKFNGKIHVAATISELLYQADAALVVTEWDEIKNLDPAEFANKMNQPIVLDGRLAFDKNRMKAAGVNYYSVGTDGLETNEPVYN